LSTAAVVGFINGGSLVPSPALNEPAAPKDPHKSMATSNCSRRVERREENERERKIDAHTKTEEGRAIESLTQTDKLNGGHSSFS
jgi:hypothetical protein